MGLIDVYRINPADQFSVFSPSLKKTQEITYYTLLAKIRGDLNITSTSGNVDNWNQAYDQTIMSGVVTGYTTKTITLTRRDGTEISFDFQDLSPASEDTLDMVTTRGNSTVNIINVGGVSTPWLDLDTSYTGTTEVGRFSWDIDNATSDLGLNNNVVLKVGQDDMWYVRNESGSAIPRGTAVMAVGTVGASGRILVSPMVANGSVAAKYLLGITSEEIADDADGYVLAKGNLRQFNTSAYTAGQVLWCNPTTPGTLTATEPAAPNLKLPIAFVVHANAVGMLAIRVTTGSTLSENNQVQFGTLANNDVLTYVSANGRWQNVPISTIASTLAFSTIAVTGQPSIVAETNQDTLNIASGTGISLTTNATTDTLTITNSAPDQVVSLTAGSNVTITGTYPSFTIAATDQYSGTVTSVNLTASTGISVSGGPITTSGSITVTNTAPDQVVSITGAGTSVVTGTYPNFTVTSNDQYVGTVTSVNLTAGTGITVAGGPITSSGSITVTNNDRGSSQNIFKNIAVPGQTTIVASTNNDTFTVKPGSGISAITLGNDITISNTDPGSSQNIFKNIAVAGQNTIVADSNNDTLSFVAGTGISLATNDTTDSLTVTNSAPDQVVALSPGTGISVSGTYPNFTITNTSPSSGGTVTSVALTAPSAFTVTGSPITTSGTIAIGGAGTASQYIRGDGQLADFPTSSGGGSSVSYYLNGSVNQGTLVGNVYRELSKTPIVGAGTDFTIAADGYIAQFITDANDPSLLEIPGGNWNIEFWFSASSSGGSPSFYVELSKYDGTTFTPISNNSAFPEFIAFGTTISQYYTALAVPQTTLAVTDRLALRVYVIHSGRTITLHTEDNHLCQVITTFSTGLNALNGLTKQVQYFAVGTSGADFNISSVTDTHTFNIPTASGANRGLLSTSDWTNFTAAYNDKINSASVTGTTTKTLTLTQQDGGTVTASWTDYDTAPVTSVFGRTGAVIAVSGDYNTSQVTENTNLYFTNARARTAISLTTTGTSGAATYDNSTGVLNVPQYQSVLTNPVTGTGTTNYVSKFTGTSTVGNSQIFDNGTNVGIGTTSPAYKLDISGTIFSGGSFGNRGVDAAYRIKFYDNGGVANDAGIGLDGSAGAEEMWFNSLNGFYWSTGTNGEKMRITQGGNVGIGTTSPATALDVMGAGTFSSSVTVKGDLFIWGGNAAQAGQITANSAGGGLYLAASGTNQNIRLVPSGTGIVQSLGSFDVQGAATFTSSVTASSLIKSGGTAAQYLMADGSVSTLTNPVTGTGTTNYVPKFTSASAIGNSQIFDNGTNVGIGTTSPSEKLSVVGGNISLGAGYKLQYSSTSYITPENNVSGAEIATGGVLTIKTGGTTERVRVDASGNVGIGTTTPSQKLEVSGALVVGMTTPAPFWNALFKDYSDGSGVYISSINGGGGKYIAGNAYYYNSALWRSDKTVASAINLDNGTVVFYTNSGLTANTDFTPSERLRITSAGNVGIGTTSPGALLEANGVIRSTRTGAASQYVEINGGDAVGPFITAAGANKVLTIQNNSTTSSVIRFNQAVASEYTWLQAGTERMRIASNGRVGIGTTSPPQALSVFGNIYQRTGDFITWNNGDAQIGAVSGFALAFSTYNGSTAMVERMRIDSSGNVGIGTTSPTASLHIGATSGVVFGATSGAVGTSQITTASAGSPVSSRFAFGTDGSGWQYRIAKNTAGTIVDLVTVADSGNVGIGTTAPNGKLQVDGDFYVNGLDRKIMNYNGAVDYGTLTNNSVRFNQNGTEIARINTSGNFGIGTTSPFSRFTVSGALSASTSQISIVNTEGGHSIIRAGISGVSNNGMSFVTANVDGSSQNVRMVVGATGNVGIGSTGPLNRLYIVSSAQNSGLSVMDFNGASGWGGGINLGITGLSLESLGKIYTSLTNGGPGTVAGDLRFQTASVGALSDRMVITSAGNVGIGTTSPANTLDIAVAQATLRLQSTTGTNSVFAKLENTAGTFFIGRDNSAGSSFGFANAAILYESGANPMVFLTNSAERLRITSAGNVGIGTTSPGAKLEVVANGESGRFNSSDTNGSFISFRNNGTARGYIGSGFHLWSSPNNIANNLGIRAESQLDLGIGSSVTMTINSSGNVGIGTTTPGTKLDVSGIARATSLSTASGLGLNVGGYAYLSQTTSGVMTFLGHNIRASDSVANTAIVQNAGWISSLMKMYYSDGITFHTDSTVYAAGATYPLSTSERMRITPAGNVGIGTTSPIAPLTVLSASTGYSSDSQIKISDGSTSYYGGLSFDDAGSTRLSVRNSYDGTGSIIGFGFGSSADKVQIIDGTGLIVNEGNVGIGTTAPAEKLHVIGNVKIEQTSNVSAILTLNPNSGALGTGYQWNLVGVNSAASYAFQIREASTAYLHINNSAGGGGGNVGIGTTSPYEKLEVAGAISATGVSAGSSAQGHSTTLAVSGGTSYLYAVDWGAEFKPLSVQGKTISLETGTGSTTARVTIDNSGNVGIGTTSPAYKLDVVGKIFSNTEIQASSAVINSSGGYASFGSNSGATPIRIGRDTTSNDIIINASGNVGIGTTAPFSTAKLQVKTATDINVAIQTGTTNTSGIKINAFNDAANANIPLELNGSILSLKTGEAERMRITAAGDVGIGTTSPSAKLHVIGNVTVSATLLTANAKLTGTLTDSFNQVGTAGQVLSSTGTGTEWVTGGGGGGSTIIVKDEGTTIGSSFTTLNFVGNNIQATASGSTAVVTAYNNAGTGSLYANDTTTQYAPTASFADVEINTVTVEAAAPDTADTSQKLIAIVTFGVENVSTYEGFNNFDFRLYNSSGTAVIADTTHSWSSYMSKDAGVKKTVFTFHIPLYDGVGATDVVTVQAKQSTAYTPEIYYCALTFIEGTN